MSKFADLVNGFRVRAGDGPDGAAVEGPVEGQDGELWRARGRVDHGRVELLLGEVAGAALAVAPREEHQLERVLVRASATAHRRHLYRVGVPCCEYQRE